MEAEAGAIPRRLQGVIQSEASIADGAVTVIFDDEKISASSIKDALAREGFPVLEEPRVFN